MDPGAGVVRDGDRRLEVVEGSRVDLAGLDADDRRGIVRGEDVAEQLDPHPALVVDRDDLLLRAPDAEQPQCPRQRDVALRPDDDAERRRPGEARSGRS